MELKRGEVWWCEFPDRKRRPYVVLTRDAAISVLRSVLAAPVTTTIRRIPTEVAIGVSDGLTKNGAISLDNLEVVPKWAFIDRIATLSTAKQHELCDAARTAIDC